MRDSDIEKLENRNEHFEINIASIRLDQRKRNNKSEQDRTYILRQIASTDREIDRLVYELYGLTEDEIKIVEGEVS